jgi:hypothetical protein
MKYAQLMCCEGRKEPFVIARMLFSISTYIVTGRKKERRARTKKV